jgi:hypothetical protein
MPPTVERHKPGTAYSCDARNFGADERLCRLHSAAGQLLDALRASVGNHCPDDKMFCSTCTPARALIAYIEAA